MIRRLKKKVKKAYNVLGLVFVLYLILNYRIGWYGIGIFILLMLIPYLFKLIKLSFRRLNYLKSPLSRIDKMAGEEFELYLEAHFHHLGYKTKHVGQTGDFGADLILTDTDGQKIAVQAKRYNSSVGVKAVQEIISARDYYGCEKAMVVTNSFYTSPAKEMAKRCEVELWDRDTCKKKFKIKKGKED